VERLRNISLFVVVAALIIGVSSLLKSPFIIEFLKSNLITILIALLAINTTTGSVVMTKLREITDTTGVDFSASIRELKLSIIEQVWFIALGIILLIAMSSPVVLALHQHVEVILSILLVAVFVASLHSLYDTANSIFVILHHENETRR
jgi:hypothetical protein